MYLSLSIYIWGWDINPLLPGQLHGTKTRSENKNQVSPHGCSEKAGLICF